MVSCSDCTYVQNTKYKFEMPSVQIAIQGGLAWSCAATACTYKQIVLECFQWKYKPRWPPMVFRTDCTYIQTKYNCVVSCIHIERDDYSAGSLDHTL
jgi:hypothetical protein